MENLCVREYNVVLTHGAIEDDGCTEFVRVRFERPNPNGFDFAEGKIPHFQFDKTGGFTEDELMRELMRFERYLRNNSALIWEFAGKGGGEYA